MEWLYQSKALTNYNGRYLFDFFKHDMDVEGLEQVNKNTNFIMEWK